MSILEVAIFAFVATSLPRRLVGVLVFAVLCGALGIGIPLVAVADATFVRFLIHYFWHLVNINDNLLLIFYYIDCAGKKHAVNVVKMRY